MSQDNGCDVSLATSSLKLDNATVISLLKSIDKNTSELAKQHLDTNEMLLNISEDTERSMKLLEKNKKGIEKGMRLLKEIRDVLASKRGTKRCRSALPGPNTLKGQRASENQGSYVGLLHDDEEMEDVDGECLGQLYDMSIVEGEEGEMDTVPSSDPELWFEDESAIASAMNTDSEVSDPQGTQRLAAPAFDNNLDHYIPSQYATYKEMPIEERKGARNRKRTAYERWKRQWDSEWREKRWESWRRSAERRRTLKKLARQATSATQNT